MSKTKIFQAKKEFWKSKTMWINLLIILGGLIAWISGQIELGLPITLSGIINAVLRVISKSEIVF
jgi:hypothetical protein